MMIYVDCDLSIWSIRAIQATAYDLAGVSSTRLTPASDKMVRIEIHYTETREQSPEEVIDMFMAKLLDHQIRQDTSKEFKVIREMIVAQAFEPCENIGEVAMTIEP